MNVNDRLSSYFSWVPEEQQNTPSVGRDVHDEKQDGAVAAGIRTHIEPTKEKLAKPFELESATNAQKAEYYTELHRLEQLKPREEPKYRTGFYFQAVEFTAERARQEQLKPEAERSPIPAQEAEHFAELHRLDQLKPRFNARTGVIPPFLIVMGGRS